jgi:hypothetical protein
MPNRVVVPARQAGNRFLGFGLQTRALYNTAEWHNAAERCARAFIHMQIPGNPPPDDFMAGVKYAWLKWNSVGGGGGGGGRLNR